VKWRIRNNLLSALFFGKLFFVKKKYDIVFIYRNTFNREEGENVLLHPFLELCKKKGHKYLLLESRHVQDETGYPYLENKNAIPFNFINYLRTKLRQVVRVKHTDNGLGPQWIKRERAVAGILKKLFFRNLETKLFITLVGYENVAFLKFIYKNTTFAEYQHGVFWCADDRETREINFFRKNSLNTNTYYLTYGKGFCDVYKRCPGRLPYFAKNVISLGYYREISPLKKKNNNKTILYTLQNVDMENNSRYYQSIKEIVERNADYLSLNGYHILFKNHPRYERGDPLIFKKNYSFISFIDDTKSLTNFSDISLHITSKSTTAFDASVQGIPTVFVDTCEERSPSKIFFDLYQYPLKDFKITQAGSLQNILKRTENPEFYHLCRKEVYIWSQSYYQAFDESIIIDLLNKDAKPYTSRAIEK